jgi:hypothetical protein
MILVYVQDNQLKEEVVRQIEIRDVPIVVRSLELLPVHIPALPQYAAAIIQMPERTTTSELEILIQREFVGKIPLIRIVPDGMRPDEATFAGDMGIGIPAPHDYSLRNSLVLNALEELRLRRNVLLGDDEVDILEALAPLLRDVGYNVLHSRTTAGAEHLFETRRVDIAVLDSVGLDRTFDVLAEKIHAAGRPVLRFSSADDFKASEKYAGHIAKPGSFLKVRDEVIRLMPPK